MHANRGKSLEKAVLELFKRYAERGIHCHQNHPRRLGDGTIVEKSPYDFEVLHDGLMWAFDAKMCEAATWNINTNAKIHQVKALHDVTEQGGRGFFLVYFVRDKQLVIFDVPLPDGAVSLRPSDGIVTKLDFLGVLTQ